MTPLFFVQNIGLGAGLAMDACAVSMTNGLKEPKMPVPKLLLIAGAFGLFQALMPIIGYFAGHALIDYIGVAIPWIALGLLTFLGGKMLYEGIKESMAAKEADKAEAQGTNSAARAAQGLTLGALFVQAIATSIDALSVGLTIADYTIPMALVAALIIAAVTFCICVPAVIIGKKFGDKLGSKAIILGGVILITIGLEICLTGVL